MRARRATFALGLGTVLAAAALRIRNALVYDIDMGFDAQGNWDYVEILRSGWTLPDPNATWSAAHPPLFYALAAGLSAALGHPDKETVVVATRLASTAIGLLAIAALGWLVWRLERAPLRVALAVGLVLFLPAHLYTSAMLSEEVLVSSLTALVVVGLAATLAAERAQRRDLGPVLALGALAGAAWLTKLSGVLVVVGGGVGCLVDGWARGSARRGLRRALIFGLAAACVGGWFYLRNLHRYGYLYPHGLEVHRVMFEMPPGERHVSDYLRFPLATFADPELLEPRLLHAVWATTYASVWFDVHRHFLPRAGRGVEIAGTLIPILALLPTLAFGVGLARALRRLVRAPTGLDAMLLALTASTLAGYVAFTWNNPWFVVVKGSFLLGLAAPFAVYGSEVLHDWLRPFGLRSALVGLALGVLWLAVAVTFTYDGVFSKQEFPGFDWRAAPALEAGGAP